MPENTQAFELGQVSLKKTVLLQCTFEVVANVHQMALERRVGPVLDSQVCSPDCPEGLSCRNTAQYPANCSVVANVHQMALERRVGPVLDSQVCSPDCPEGLSCRNTAQYPANCSVRFLSPLANN
ncbi:UNVERIFIED_CONTAM: hypothetical protein FKN15_031775 [Acipenser sinensis]